MILTELELQNFGVYQGTHKIALEPPSPERPIVLFGGLNGAGKTTILEAIQLALFGKRTPTAKRESLSYDDYLRRCINHSVPTSEGAAVRLRFLIRTEGELRGVRISRFWRETKSGVREVEEVHCGTPGEEKPDPFLSDRWAEYIDEIVPLGVAPLFFFDGDRIEGFADLANSGELIRTAVHGLLGLDLVDRLKLDLQVLERRKRSALKDSGFVQGLRDAEARVEKLESEVKAKAQELEEKRSVLKTFCHRLDAVEEEFRREGGHLYAERGRFEAELRHVQGSVAEAEAELRAIAAGQAPLLLVEPLLQRIREEDGHDQEREAGGILHQVLEARDSEIESFVRDLSHAPGLPITDALHEYLESDRERRMEDLSGEPVFGLSHETRAALEVMLSSGLDETRAEVRTTLIDLTELASQAEKLERELEAVPEEEAIQSLLRRRGEVRSAVAEAERNVRLGEEEYERALREAEKARKDRFRLEARANDREWENEAAARIVQNSERARENLSDFRVRVLERNVERIGQLVLESFRKLLRKDLLVHRLDIDPVTLSLTLFGSAGQELHPDRLSAGERQLLAVSLLWGLAQASQRALPTIVDTPLGRLDSIHREHLVERYFPNASHQVILLSTDKEIDEAHLNRLAGSIGRSYHLDHDEATGRTSVREGYFEKAMA